MPRAKHPATAVLEYFRTAPLAAAEQLLYLIKQEMTVRQNATNKPIKRRKRRTRAEMEAVKAVTPVRGSGPIRSYPPTSEAALLGSKVPAPPRRRVSRPPGLPGTVATEPLDSV